MLHHDEAGKVGGQRAQQILERLGATRGGADGNHLVGGREVAAGGQFDRSRHRRGHSSHLDPGRGLDLGDDFAGLLDGAVGHIEFWLGYVIDRSQAQRSQGRFRAAFGERGNHDHRHGMAAHQLLQERQAVHPRHLNIQRQHIRVEGLDFLPGDEGIARGSDDLQLRVRAEYFRQQLPHQ